MHLRAIAAASLLAMGLAGCGGAEQPEVVEQIKVREPGQPDKNAAAATAAPATAAGDLVAAGKAAFAACAGCHVAEQGAESMAGPNLYGVVGRKAGALDDFAYSDALKASGIIWSEAELDAFLADPAGKVAGTSMAAGGVSNAQQRAAIVAYLGSLSQ